MATAEELLAQMEENPEPYADSVGPVNDVIMIDAETRTIELPESEKIFGVESDKASERKYFRCQKIVGDNIDLSTLNLFINFKNANNEGDIYHIDDVVVDGDYITFSWKLSRKVTAYKTDAGKNQLLSFIFCAKSGEGPDNEWNTTLCSDGIVLEGLEPGDSIAEENPDIIQYILERLESAGTITPEQISESVEEYFASNPIEETDPTVPTWAKEEAPDKSLTQEGKAADAKEVGDRLSELSDEKVDKQDGYSMVIDAEKEVWNNKSDFSGNYEDLTNKPTIPTKTSQLTNDSKFSTFSGSYNDLSDKPTIPGEYALPIATSTTLGGVKPVAKTDEMTQEVGVDELGGLFTKEGGGNSGEILSELQLASGTVVAGAEAQSYIDTGVSLAMLKKYKRWLFAFGGASNVGLQNTYLKFNNNYSIARSDSASGFIYQYEWLNVDTNLLRAYCVFQGNTSLVRAIGSKYGLSSIPASWENGTAGKVGCILFDLSALNREETLGIFLSDATTIDYNWEVRGLTV